MKLKTSLLLLPTIVINLNLCKAQADPSKYTTIDSLLGALYGSISGEKGEARDWETFAELFHIDAKLIPTGKGQAGLVQARYMSPADYKEQAGPWLVNNGFYEKEIHREVHTFGPITQVFSTYESFRSKMEKTPFMRGINSIQLLNDGKRWWIINIYWSQETKENPIPEQFLND